MLKLSSSTEPAMSKKDVTHVSKFNGDVQLTGCAKKLVFFEGSIQKLSF